MKKLLNSFAALLLSGIVMALPVSVGASSGAGLTFSPGYLVVSIPAGQSSADSSFSVKNDSDTTVKLTAVPTDVDTNSSSLTSLGTATSQATKSLTVKDAVISLAPGKSVNFLLHFDASRLSAGGQYTSVLVKSVNESITKSVPIHQAASIGIFVIKETGAERSLTLDTNLPKGIVLQPPSNLLLKLKAGGNVTVVPRAAISVSGEGGTVLAKATINDTSEGLKPGEVGSYTVPLRYEGGLSAGRHVVTITYRYDGLETPLMVTSTFWYVPVWYLLIVALGVGMLVWIWVLHKRGRSPTRAPHN